RWLHVPVGLGLQFAVSRGPRVGIVDENHPVTNEHAIFDRHALANEAMARDLAAFPDRCILLDLYESADLCFVADLASVEIDELRQFDIAPELYIGGYTQKLIYNIHAIPFTYLLCRYCSEFVFQLCGPAST